MRLPTKNHVIKLRFGLAVSMAITLLLPASLIQFEANAQEVVPTINLNLATTELHVGPGQTYSNLQAALDTIPAVPTENYKVVVHPATYGGQTTLSGKDTAANGTAIQIVGDSTNKPVFRGGLVRGSGSWSTLGGYKDIYYTADTGVLAVTDGANRLNKVSSLAQLQRSTNAWYASASTVYVRLHDLATPNSRTLYLLTMNTGLHIQGVPNVLVEDLAYEHYASQGIHIESSSSVSVRSVLVNDIGGRAATDAGVFFDTSANSSAINIIGTRIMASAVRVDGSINVQILNGSFHHDLAGIELANSTNGLVQNNIFGLDFKDPIMVDAASTSGLVSKNNVYWNPSGAIGEVANVAKYSTALLGAAAGGETNSLKDDPSFRSPTTALPVEVSNMEKKVHDLSSGLYGGMAWSQNPDAAKLRWDQGFIFESQMDMYRATRDVRWLDQLVKQADAVWAQAEHNTATPGGSDDGYLGWDTSRYSVAIAKRATLASAGASIRFVDSGGTLISNDLRLYGPGTADNVPNKTLEIRFTSTKHFDVWDVTGAPTCLNCGGGDNYPGGTSVTIKDPTIKAAATWDIPFQAIGSAPQNGDIFEIDLRAKKELEYPNIDGGLLAPTIDFAVEVLNDPSLQVLPVAGTTMLLKAQEYINSVDSEIYDKWEPYYKALDTEPGAYTTIGGVYAFPCDEHYSIPCNTMPVNMNGDIGRLWARMWQATGDIKYYRRARKIALFLNTKLGIKVAPDGKSFYDWNYYYPAGSWDTWTEVISEDLNHGGIVIKFIRAIRDTGIAYTENDLQLFANTFLSQLWDPNNNQIYWYFNRTFPWDYANRIYYFHSWLDLPGGDAVAELIHDSYQSYSFNTDTGVVYQMMSDAALHMSEDQLGLDNYRVRADSPAVRSGINHSYDRDYDGRKRSSLGTFDRGAYSFILLDRIYGASRYDTAIEIAKYQYSQAGKANMVALARGDDFADGLAGAPFASQEGGPILLTDSSTLLPEVMEEIRRTLPKGKTVWLLGGKNALSESIADTLRAKGYNVERFEGADRYETAAMIASTLTNITELFVASGTSFPDALAAASVAVNRKAGIILTKGNELPQHTKDFLSATRANTLHVVGGPVVVSSSVVGALKAYGSVDQIYGSNRYSTSTALAKKYYPSADTVTFARGDKFPDSLVAGSLAGSSQVEAPLVLVKPNEVPGEIEDYLNDVTAQIMGGLLFGGPAAVSSQVKDDLESLL